MVEGGGVGLGLYNTDFVSPRGCESAWWYEKSAVSCLRTCQSSQSSHIE